MTDTIRKTLHLTRATLDRLDPYVHPGEGLARAVQWRLQRLGEILAGAVPELDAAQWLAVCAAADAMPPDGRDALWIIQAVRRWPNLAEAWNLDAPALAARLEALPYPAMCAVEDVAQVFSGLAGLEGEPSQPEDRLRRALVIVSGGRG
jgi:hypothetical protein